MAVEPRKDLLIGPLRLAYTAAAAATVAASHEYYRYISSPNARKEGRMRRVAALAAAEQHERAAGWAFLEALDDVDPCCSVCGCTYRFACQTAHGPCSWVYGVTPRICTACKAASLQPHKEVP